VGPILHQHHAWEEFVGITQEKQRSRRRACSLSSCCCCCCYVHHEQLAASDPTLVDHKRMTQVTRIREKLPDILDQAGSVVVHAMSDLWRMEESTIVNGPTPRLVFLPSFPSGETLKTHRRALSGAMHGNQCDDLRTAVWFCRRILLLQGLIII
jgi:hypothetical protein